MTAIAMLELSHDSRSQRKTEDEKPATISATPNDPKLSDGGAWRGSCEVERMVDIRARKECRTE
jgi:hypothetical protein